MDCGARGAWSRTSNRFVHGARAPGLTPCEDAVEPGGVEPAAHELPQDHARDSRYVAHRPEVASPRPLRVQGGDGHRATRDAQARGGDQHLALEHETPGRAVLHLDALEEGGRIDAEPRLTVLERLPRGPADEEVGGAIGDIARARRGFPPEPPCADDDLAGMSARRREQAPDLLWGVLAVAVERDDAGGAQAKRVPHPAPQAPALAEVAVVPKDGDRKARERGRGPVGRTVVDDDDPLDLRERASGDIGDRRRLVVSRDDDRVTRLASLRSRHCILSFPCLSRAPRRLRSPAP